MMQKLFPARGLPKVEERISPNDPRVSLARPDSWLFEAFGAQPTAVGISVNERSALKATAVYASVRILAETVASLPCEIFRRDGVNGKEVDTTHPLYDLLHDCPNEEQSAFTFWETMQGSIALWGNAYAERELNGKGETIGLWPIAPDRVNPKRVNGARVYEIGLSAGGGVTLDSDHIFHVPGMGFDGLIGYSPIYLLRQAIGLSLATEEFGARFFGNGSRPGGVLEHPKTMSPEAAKRLKQSFEEAQSGLTNAQRVLLLEEGTVWKPMSIPPDDAQFLETRKFQVSEIARIFRVPPHMLADLERATFSNIEQQSLEFVLHSIRPWLKRWEQSIAHQLMAPDERAIFFAKFQYNELLRGDQAARGEYYTKMLQTGALSPNEIRAEEGMNPIPDGDKRFVPLNMVTLDQAGVVPEPTPAPAVEDPADPAMRGSDPEAATEPTFAVGDRVRALVNHMPRMKGMAGAVAIANAGSPPYYAVNFDEPMGEGNPHKWLAENEIASDDGGMSARALAPVIADVTRRIRARLDTAQERAMKKGQRHTPTADDLDYAERAMAPAHETATLLGSTVSTTAQAILDLWVTSLEKVA
jgi:HK97 family phage portal protein